MYARDVSREMRTDVLIAAMRGIRLCALVSQAENGMQATHLPVLVEQSDDGIMLLGHMARNNPHWRNVRDGVESIAVFQGPHTYITPSWYATKRETGKVVPTWAYIAVHAHGRLEVIEDHGWLRDHVSALSDHHEAGRDEPWAVSDAPEDYLAVMLRGIVGIRMKLERIEGAWKLNQHRGAADQAGTYDGLIASGGAPEVEIAGLMRQACPTLNDPDTD